MRSTISIISCLAVVLAFAANLAGQTISRASFENGFGPVEWIQPQAVLLQPTSGADGSPGFARLISSDSRLEGNLTGSPTRHCGGLADFFIEFAFRINQATNGGFHLRIECQGESNSAPISAVNLQYNYVKKWVSQIESKGQVSRQLLGERNRIQSQDWYHLRFVGRDWGQTNAHFEVFVSNPKTGQSILAATNLTNFGSEKTPLQSACRFSLGHLANTDAGFDVDELFAGSIAAYHGPVVKAVDTSTLTGKAMCGYQGWFGTPGDGRAEATWRHWTKHSGGLADGNAKVDLWPDVSELEPAQRFPTGFKLPNGRPAEVFSSFQKPTVLKHFQWMQDYGIDGVFVQRFVNDLKPASSLEHCNTVLVNCREGANRHGRTYAVMYDLSGLQAGRIQEVMNDWRTLRREMAITDDAAYLNHRGKPVVAVWGIGFNDGRAYTLAECRQLVEFLKDNPEVGGCTVMLGVPANWRELKGDALNDPQLLEIAALADVISPWTVGRYSTPAGAAQYAENSIKPDLAWCHERGLDYLPVVFPGFSWHNMQGGPLNQIPRLRGQFLWSQFCEAKRMHAMMVYVAMFDEVDEGTAIFKCTNEVPLGEKSRFSTFEGLAGDFYLKMVGAGTQLIRGNRSPADKLSHAPDTDWVRPKTRYVIGADGDDTLRGGSL